MKKISIYCFAILFIFHINLQAYSSDPAKFVNAFSEFNQNLNGGFELHEAIIGAQKGVTHYLVARQTNLAEWLKGREGVLNSGAGAQFQSSSQGAVDIMFNVGLNLIKSYNQD